MPQRIIFTDIDSEEITLECFANNQNNIFIEIDSGNGLSGWISLDCDTSIKLVKHLKKEIGIIKQSKEVGNG